MDNGLTWNYSNATFNAAEGWINNVVFSDNNKGLFIHTYSDGLGGQKGTLYSTTDGGLNWIELSNTRFNGNYKKIVKNYILGYNANKTINLFKI